MSGFVPLCKALHFSLFFFFFFCYFTSIANLTELKFFSLRCSTFFCCFSWMEHAAAILLQNRWDWSPISGGGSLWSRCGWRDFALLRQCESHVRAVVPCILCTSCSIHLLHQLLRKSQAARRGGGRVLSHFYLFLPVLALEGTCQNNFLTSGCKGMMLVVQVSIRPQVEAVVAILSLLSSTAWEKYCQDLYIHFYNE